MSHLRGRSMKRRDFLGGVLFALASLRMNPLATPLDLAKELRPRTDMFRVMPKLLPQGLMPLRELAIMPDLLKTNYRCLPIGRTIDVPIPRLDSPGGASSLLDVKSGACASMLEGLAPQEGE